MAAAQKQSSASGTSLTIIAIKARKAIRYSIYAIVFIVIGRLVLIGAVNAYHALVPKPPPPPTVGFGKLTNIPFPDLNIELPEISYTTETATGDLPSFPDQMSVFYMPQKTATLFSYDTMKQVAKTFGFTNDPQQENETVYKFIHPKIPATFEANVVYGTFSLSFNLAEDSSPLASRAPDVDTATKIVRQQLGSSGNLPEDLSGPVTNEFLRVEGQNLIRALSLSDAQLTKINLFRKPMTISEVDYPSVTANPKEANVWFIVSNDQDRTKKLIAGEYKYFAVDETKFETYPIITAQQAVDELKNGKGYIANLGLNTSGQVTVRKIYLAYFDPGTPYTFYQPVVVLEGDGDFVAYVPAVTAEYYGADTQAGN